MNKRELVARGLENRIVQRWWSSAGARRNGLRILAYHRVCDDDPTTFAFDEELISATSAGFAQQMGWARRNFDVISFADLHRCGQEDRAWPERALIITFDDGYRDNFTHAWPILRDNGLSATIFLASDFIGGTRLFWWDLVAYCLKRTQRLSASLPAIACQPLPLNNALEKRAAINKVLDWIKQAPEADKNRFLADLPDNLGVALPDMEQDRMHLSWSEVQQMAAFGIEFGSHTCSHPILANIDVEQLEREVTQSKLVIEQHIDQEVVAFSYPVGGASHFNERVQQEVASAGFHYATSYQEGLVDFEVRDCYALPRIHVEANHSLALFRANLMFPKLMLR